MSDCETKLDRVRALHHKVLVDKKVLCRECSHKFPGILYLTEVPWPCTTTRILDGGAHD